MVSERLKWLQKRQLVVPWGATFTAGADNKVPYIHSGAEGFNNQLVRCQCCGAEGTSVCVGRHSALEVTQLFSHGKGKPRFTAWNSVALLKANRSNWLTRKFATEFGNIQVMEWTSVRAVLHCVLNHWFCFQCSQLLSAWGIINTVNCPESWWMCWPSSHQFTECRMQVYLWKAISKVKQGSAHSLPNKFFSYTCLDVAWSYVGISDNRGLPGPPLLHVIAITDHGACTLSVFYKADHKYFTTGRNRIVRPTHFHGCDTQCMEDKSNEASMQSPFWWQDQSTTFTHICTRVPSCSIGPMMSQSCVGFSISLLHRCLNLHWDSSVTSSFLTIIRLQIRPFN